MKNWQFQIPRTTYSYLKEYFHGCCFFSYIERKFNVFAFQFCCFITWPLPLDNNCFHYVCKYWLTLCILSLSNSKVSSYPQSPTLTSTPEYSFDSNKEQITKPSPSPHSVTHTHTRARAGQQIFCWPPFRRIWVIGKQIKKEAIQVQLKTHFNSYFFGHHLRH